MTQKIGYLRDGDENIVYPKTLSKCVKKGDTTLDEYLGTVSDATTIKETVSGSDITITDSSNANIQELHLCGRTEQDSTNGTNLFNVNDVVNKSTILSVDEEGYVASTLPANNTDTDKYYSFFTEKSDLIKPDTNYLMFCEISEIPRERCELVPISLDTYQFKGQMNTALNYTSSGLKRATIRTRSNFSDCQSMCRGYVLTKPGFTGGKVKFRISILEDTTVTTDTFQYEPYTGGMPSPNPEFPQKIKNIENPSINILGKNLFDASQVEYTYTANCSTTVENEEIMLTATVDATGCSAGTIVPVGTTIVNVNKCLLVPCIEGLSYRVSFRDGIFNNVASNFLNKDYKSIAAYYDGNRVMTAPKGSKWLNIRVGVTNVTQGTVYRDSVQVEICFTATEYEHYKPLQTATINYELNAIDDVKDELIVKADGTGQFVQRYEKITATELLKTTITPSLSEKNHMFVCRSVKIKKIHKKMYNKSLCNYFVYNPGLYSEDKVGFNCNYSNTYSDAYIRFGFGLNGISTINEFKDWLTNHSDLTVMYPLQEPITTELTAEEVKQILALHTNKPVTNVWNDQGADMQITYVADSKTYIDNKFKELSEAIISSTSTSSTSIE